MRYLPTGRRVPTPTANVGGRHADPGEGRVPTPTANVGGRLLIPDAATRFPEGPRTHAHETWPEEHGHHCAAPADRLRGCRRMRRVTPASVRPSPTRGALAGLEGPDGRERGLGAPEKCPALPLNLD